MWDKWDSDAITNTVESSLDQYYPKADYSIDEKTTENIMDKIKKQFLDEIEAAYTYAYEGIEQAFDNGIITEEFKDTFIEYVNNRNSKYWSPADFF
jgi:uncharacterized protein YggL (DUF469 family)|tara:strand:- start:165 stop:452 length:288 start_codon:yes stop_codon:yes gene_type:complete